MEETAAKPPQAAAPPAHAPVMDVIASHKTPAVKAAPEPLAVAPEPPAKDTGAQDKPADTKKDTPKTEEKPKQPVAPKQHSNGVGMAIFATVVIVLGLAALATFAYLKT